VEKKIAGEPVSRILCRATPGALRGGDHSSRPQLALRLQQPTRGLLFALLDSPHSDRSTRTKPRPLARTLAQRAGPALPSYLALHHAGFSVPPVSPPERWALTPPFHPCQAVCRCRTFARLCRRRFAGFPARRHRAALHRRSIFCGTFRDAIAAAGLPRRRQLRPLALPGALPFTLTPPKAAEGFTPSPPESSSRFVRHRLLRAYDDGVRTFLPFTLRRLQSAEGLTLSVTQGKPAITRLTRYKYCNANRAIWMNRSHSPNE